jgi:hypothetical protein
MHANVLVSTINEEGFTVDELLAWKAEVDEQGSVHVWLQDPHAEGHMPAGEIELAPSHGATVRIEANW